MSNKLHKALMVTFFVIVIIAAFSLAIPTLSYVEFFESIEKLSLVVEKFEVQAEGEDLMINATFFLSNKGNYALEIQRVSCKISLQKTSGTFEMIKYPIFEFPGPPYTPLQPNSNVTIGPSRIKIERAGISLGQTATWMINSEALINSFLGTISILFPSVILDTSIS